MSNPEYKIGDVANGHVLTEQGWMPLPVAAAPVKKKMPVLAKVAIIGGAGLFGMIACTAAVAAGGGSKTPTPSAASTSQSPSKSDTPSQSSTTAAPKPKPVVPKTAPSQIGKWVVDNHIAFKVTSISTARHIGSSDFGDTAHGKFVIVHAVVKNTDNKEHDLNSTQTLIDVKGAQYDTYDKADFDLDNSVGMLDALNPGISKSVVMVFETPTSTVPMKVNVVGGWLSGGTDIWLRAHKA